MRRVEVFQLMRKDHKFGPSIRVVARKRGVHQRAVRQALSSSIPRSASVRCGARAG